MNSFLLFAEDPPPPAGPFGGPLGPLFILALGMLFLFVVVFPAQSRRQRREQEQLMASLKRGAKVLTSSGIVGTVVSAKEGEDEIVIKSEDTRLRVKRSVVIQVIGTDEAEASKS